MKSTADKKADGFAGVHDDEFGAPFEVLWSRGNRPYAPGWYWRNVQVPLLVFPKLTIQEMKLAGPFDTSKEAFEAANFQTSPAIVG